MNNFDGVAFDEVAFDMTQPPLRIGGGKRIASYTIDDSGRIRQKIDAFLEMERKQDEADNELIAALLAYYMKG